MTLEYESRHKRPPSLTGLRVWGAITLLVGLLCVLGGGLGLAGSLALQRITTISAATVGTTAPPTGLPATTPASSVATLPATGPASPIAVRVSVTPTGSPVSTNVLVAMIAGLALMYGVVGLWLCWLGIDTIRGRRWVRPAMLTLSGWVMVTSLSSIPFSLMMAAQAISVGGLVSWALAFDVVSRLLSSLAFGLGVPLLAFRFFRGDACVETLRHRDPRPSWTDAWPVAVFAVGVAIALTVAVRLGTFLVFSGVALSGVASVTLAGAVWSGLATMVSVSLGVATAVACYRSRWGRVSAWPAWRLAVAWVIFGTVSNVIPELFFPEIARLQEEVILKSMTSGSTTFELPRMPSGPYRVMATIAGDVVLLAALWVLQGSFRRVGAAPQPVRP